MKLDKGEKKIQNVFGILLLAFFKGLGDGYPWSENWRSGYDVGGRDAYFTYSFVVLFDFFSHMCTCMIKKKTQKQNKTKRQTTESLMVWGKVFDDIFNML